MGAVVRKFARTCFCCTVSESCEPGDGTAGMEMTEREPSAAQTGSCVNTQLTPAAAPSDNNDTSAINGENDDDDTAAEVGGDDDPNLTFESGGATGHPSPCTSEDSATVIDDFFDNGPLMGEVEDEEGYHSEGGNNTRNIEFTGGARADAVGEENNTEGENIEMADDVEEKVTMTSQRDLGGFQQE